MKDHKIFEFVDKSLSSLKEEELMTIPHDNMPIEMMDTSQEQEDDWIPWKAIPSQVTDKDIKNLESKIALNYPEGYKEFLKYKHFYELENTAEIDFFEHCVRYWKSKLTEYYFDYWEPEELIEKGFIPFAHYSDWGIVCFDTNRMKNNDCPVIMFDHETLYNDTIAYEELYESFQNMTMALLNKLNGES